MTRKTCLFATVALLGLSLRVAAQPRTEESFIPNYTAASLHYLWGSSADLDGPGDESFVQHEFGVLGQYPFWRNEDSRLTAGLRFRANFLDFEQFNDLDLYRLQIPINYWRALNQQWKIWGGVEPGLFTDFDNVSGDAFAVTALAVAAYDWRPDWTVSFGAYYSRDLGEDRLLPVLGVIWRPNAHWNVSATFPRFRVAYAPSEIWNVDFTIRPGGSSWAVRGRNDREVAFDYQSWRASVGFERLVSRSVGKAYIFAEAGLGFAQKIEIKDGGDELYSRDAAEIVTLSTGLRLRF